MITKLRKGERLRKDGRYEYRVTKRGITISKSAKTLAELREKEEELEYMRYSGINLNKRNVTLNDEYEVWKENKIGLKENTLCNYVYMYEKFVKKEFGNRKIVDVLNSDITTFYNQLYIKHHLKANTIDTIHTVIHQLFVRAISDNIIRYNPADGALKELKRAEKNRSRNEGNKKIMFLTKEEQETLLDFIQNSIDYKRWYPIFGFMFRTGLRVGELCALQMDDIDYNNRTIHINKNLQVYTKKISSGKNKTFYKIDSTKTEAGERDLYLSNELIELVSLEKEIHDYAELKCVTPLCGYSKFVFLNKEGSFYKGCTLNKALSRIISSCNAKLMRTGQQSKLLPHVHNHMIRHSFNTRMKEAGVQVEDRMKALGQTDADVNIKIYTHTDINSVRNAMEKTSNYCYNLCVASESNLIN